MKQLAKEHSPFLHNKAHFFGRKPSCRAYQRPVSSELKTKTGLIVVKRILKGTAVTRYLIPSTTSPQTSKTSSKENNKQEVEQTKQPISLNVLFADKTKRSSKNEKVLKSVENAKNEIINNFSADTFPSPALVSLFYDKSSFKSFDETSVATAATKIALESAMGDSYYHTFSKLESTPFFSKLSSLTKVKDPFKLVVFVYFFFFYATANERKIKSVATKRISSSVKNEEKKYEEAYSNHGAMIFQEEKNLKEAFDTQESLQRDIYYVNCPILQIGNN